MTFMLIGHTADNSYDDRRGDYYPRPGKFETQFFRAEEKEKFLWASASAKYHNTYDDLVVVIDGVPEEHVSSENDPEWERFTQLEREADAVICTVRVQDEAAEANRKEIEAAEQATRTAKLAEYQRADELAVFEPLRVKLGR